MELLAVVMLLGVLAAAGVSRMHRGTLYNIGAQGDARRIAIDLLQARRRAISTGSNHLVRFTLDAGGHATSFVVERRDGISTSPVESPRAVPAGVTITPSVAALEFTFEGSALGAYSVAVAGEDKAWTVTVVPSTGTVRVVQAP